MKKLFKTLIAVLFCLTIVVSLPLIGWAENGVIQENDVGIHNSDLGFNQIPIKSNIIMYEYVVMNENTLINIKPSAALLFLISEINLSNNTNFIPAIMNKNRRTVNFNPVTITGHVGKFLI